MKRYVAEAGSDKMHALMATEATLCTSKLTFAEVCASLARRRRAGDLQDENHRIALNSFLRDWETLILVDLLDDILPVVQRLVGSHPLRGADSVHLASAVWIRDKTGAALTFAASDKTLKTAAESEGFRVFDPAEK